MVQCAITRNMTVFYCKHDMCLPEAQYFFFTSIGGGLILILRYAYNVCGLALEFSGSAAQIVMFARCEVTIKRLF